MRAFERPQHDPGNTLTPRQQQVLRLLAAGRTNPEIAETLGVTLAGAKWHVSEVISRLGVTSREEAAEWWRKQNRLPSRFARSVRSLLGAGLLKTVAAGAAAAALGGGVAVAATMLNRDGRGADNSLALKAAASVATPTPIPPSAATKDGLTLRVVGTKISDIETTIEVVLEGRPELGRFASPGFTGAPGQALRDQQGNVYRQRSMGGSASDSRFLSFTFDPVPSSATALTLTIADAQFVNPASEVPEGQRPPDPSAVIAGPWVVEIAGFIRKVNTQVAVDHTPRTFGTAAIVIDEIRQPDELTVVYARLVGFPEQDVHGLRLEWELVDANGNIAATRGGRWGDGPQNERIEWRFAQTTGLATIRLVGHAKPPIAPDARIFINDRDTTPPSGVISEEGLEFRRRDAELVARVEAMFVDAQPAEWTVILP